MADAPKPRVIRYHPDQVTQIIKDGGRLDFAHSLDAAAQKGNFLARPHLSIDRYTPAKGHAWAGCCWQETTTGPPCGDPARVAILDPIGGRFAALCWRHTQSACTERIETVGTDAERTRARALLERMRAAERREAQTIRIVKP